VPGGGIAIKRQPVASESSLAPNLDWNAGSLGLRFAFLPGRDGDVRPRL